jgi:hypothetical protein
MKECDAWDFGDVDENTGKRIIILCHEPATHSAYGPLGILRFYCARHFDQMVAVIRGFEGEGRYPLATSRVRKLNPGLL